MRALLVLVLATGCRQLLGFEQPVAGDATVDVDGSLVETCIGSVEGLLPNTCFLPSDPLLILEGTLDTTSSALCNAASGDEVCFVVAGRIEVSNLIATGARPLVLWSSTTIEITQALDASSRRGNNGKTGPAANPARCDPLDAGSTGTIPQSGAGGSGGSYSNAGGAGGLARSGSNFVTNEKIGELQPTALAGGCGGGRGGLSPNSSGDGGGAIYVMAAEQILISGAITASGAGGGPGVGMLGLRGGGGGGGSGGLIGLDAPVIALQGAQLVALGGGGGSGAGTITGIGIAGDGGDEPVVELLMGVGAGGGSAVVSMNGGGSGSDGLGGAGAAGGDVATSEEGGGGGGGGGPGRIVLFGTVMIEDSLIAPPAP